MCKYPDIFGYKNYTTQVWEKPWKTTLYNGICIPCMTVFILKQGFGVPLQWCYNERDSISNHRRCYCLLNCVGSGPDQRKHQSSASLAFVQGIHHWQVNSPHKRLVTRKMFSFDDVIMLPVLPAMYLHNNRIELTWKKQAKNRESINLLFIIECPLQLWWIYFASYGSGHGTVAVLLPGLLSIDSKTR